VATNLILSATLAGRGLNFATEGTLLIGNRANRDKGVDGAFGDVRFYTGTGDSNLVEHIRLLAANPPTGLVGTGGENSVALSWTARADATGYNVKRATVSGGPYQTLAPAGMVTATSYTDATAVNGTRYYYVISAATVYGETVNSAEIGVTPGPACTPPVITTQPVAQTVCAGGAVAFSVAATGTGLTYQWQTSTNNGTSWTDLSGQTAAHCLIPAVSFADHGRWFRVIVSGDCEPAVPSQAVALSVNRAPAGTDRAAGGLENKPIVLALAKLLMLWSDPDGDPVTVTSVDAASARGGVVSWDQTAITYHPPTNYVGTDTFHFVVSDINGCATTAAITLTVSSKDALSSNVVYGPVLEGTDLVVRFAGVPGESYTVEFTSSLTPANWQKKTNLTAPAPHQGLGIGIFEFRDTTGATAGFYRTVWPAY
jgi:fibronectin type 3 domain-containing protein